MWILRINESLGDNSQQLGQELLEGLVLLFLLGWPLKLH